MKKSIKNMILLITALSLTSLSTAFAEGEINVKQTKDVISVYGTITADETSEDVQLIVLSPGVTLAGLENINYGNGKFAYLDELLNIKAESSKISYNFDIDFSNKSSATYNFYLKSDDAVYTYKVGNNEGYEFINGTDRNSAIQRVLGATDKTTQITTDEKPLTAVGIEVADLLTLNAKSDIANKVCTEFNSYSGTDLEADIAKKFNGYIGAELLRTSQKTDYSTILATYIDSFPLSSETRKNYDDLIKAEKESQIISLLKDSDKINGNSFETVYTNLEKAFKESTSVAMLSTSTSNSQVIKILQDYGAINTLASTSTLDSYNLQLFYGDFIGKNFDSFNAFESYYATRLEARGPKTPTPPLGGGGVSSSFSSTNKPDDVVSEDEENPVVFTDIESVPWAIKSINALAEKNILNGDGKGNFRPNDNITRAEFVKVLVCAFNLTDKTAVSDFKDVPATHWAYEYISTAKKLNLINGVGENRFGATDYITRQDIAVIIDRYLNKNAQMYSVQFNDKDNISAYALNAAGSMQARGIITGDDLGKFNPTKYATRAEVAVIITRCMGL